MVKFSPSQGNSFSAQSSFRIAERKQVMGKRKKTTRCYTDDWQRTEPDYVLFLPKKAVSRHGDNEHVIVVETPDGDLLATWTTGTYEAAPDSHTLYCRSRNGGKTWTQPKVMPGTNDGPMLNGRWGFSVVSRSGRIYFFYNRCAGIWDPGWPSCGWMGCRYSDDDGRTWKNGETIPFRRREAYDNPDPKVPCGWIVWQPAIRDSQDRPIVGFTRWSSLTKFPKPRTGWHCDSRSELMRFDNLDEGPHPKDLQITWLPEGGDDKTISVPCPFEPEKSKGYSLAEEPAVVLLPDGRLFLIMRTVTGCIWYTVSEDDGASWRPTEVLRYRDDGPEVPVLSQSRWPRLWSKRADRYGCATPDVHGSRRISPQGPSTHLVQ
jgi:hypothetical protein